MWARPRYRSVPVAGLRPLYNRLLSNVRALHNPPAEAAVLGLLLACRHCGRSAAEAAGRSLTAAAGGAAGRRTADSRISSRAEHPQQRSNNSRCCAKTIPQCSVLDTKSTVSADTLSSVHARVLLVCISRWYKLAVVHGLRASVRLGCFGWLVFLLFLRLLSSSFLCLCPSGLSSRRLWHRQQPSRRPLRRLPLTSFACFFPSSLSLPCLRPACPPPSPSPRPPPSSSSSSRPCPAAAPHSSARWPSRARTAAASASARTAAAPSSASPASTPQPHAPLQQPHQVAGQQASRVSRESESLGSTSPNANISSDSSRVNRPRLCTAASRPRLRPARSAVAARGRSVAAAASAEVGWSVRARLSLLALLFLGRLAVSLAGVVVVVRSVLSLLALLAVARLDHGSLCGRGWKEGLGSERADGCSADGRRLSGDGGRSRQVRAGGLSALADSDRAGDAMAASVGVASAACRGEGLAGQPGRGRERLGQLVRARRESECTPRAGLASTAGRDGAMEEPWLAGSVTGRR